MTGSAFKQERVQMIWTMSPIHVCGLGHKLKTLGGRRVGGATSSLAPKTQRSSHSVSPWPPFLVLFIVRFHWILFLRFLWFNGDDDHSSSFGDEASVDPRPFAMSRRMWWGREKGEDFYHDNYLELVHLPSCRSVVENFLIDSHREIMIIIRALRWVIPSLLHF